MSETQILGPCTECGTPRDACTAPDYCCDECLHHDANWDGYAPLPPAEPTDDVREQVIATLAHRSWCGWLMKHHQKDRHCTCLADRERDADAVLALPAVRDALAAQETVRRVSELHRPIDHEAYPAEDGDLAYCDADGFIWPCWTHRVLNGETP